MRFDVDVTKRVGDGTIALSFASDAAVTALVGPSGIGKTTILNMIAGVRRPDHGRIAVDGRTLFDRAAAIDEPPERRRCGYVFQDDRLFPHYSVRGNLLYGAAHGSAGEALATFDDVVAMLGIGHLLQRRPASLSGGEARRVAIGRALLARPAFLLMDEPLSSLDLERREAMLAAIETIRSHYNLPILYVSHQQDEVARVAGRIIDMVDQRSIARSSASASTAALRSVR